MADVEATLCMVPGCEAEATHESPRRWCDEHHDLWMNCELDGSEEPEWMPKEHPVPAPVAEPDWRSPDWKFPPTRNNEMPPSFDEHLKKVFAERASDLSPAVLRLLRELWSLGVGAGSGGCQACNNGDGCEPECARTRYHWDGKGDNPNRYQVLCRECAELHHEYWDEMWREYYASQGC